MPELTNSVFPLAAELRSALLRLEQGDAAGQTIDEALRDNSRRPMMLRLLLFHDFPFDVIEPAFGTLLDFAVDGTPDSLPPARTVVLKYTHIAAAEEYIRAAFERIIHAAETRPHSGDDYYLFRGLADLMTLRQDAALFRRLMEICRTSGDADIKEIYDEFREFIPCDSLPAGAASPPP